MSIEFQLISVKSRLEVVMRVDRDQRKLKAQLQPWTWLNDNVNQQQISTCCLWFVCWLQRAQSIAYRAFTFRCMFQVSNKRRRKWKAKQKLKHRRRARKVFVINARIFYIFSFDVEQSQSVNAKFTDRRIESATKSRVIIDNWIESIGRKSVEESEKWVKLEFSHARKWNEWKILKLREQHELTRPRSCISIGDCALVLRLLTTEFLGLVPRKTRNVFKRVTSSSFVCFQHFELIRNSVKTFFGQSPRVKIVVQVKRIEIVWEFFVINRLANKQSRS